MSTKLSRYAAGVIEASWLAAIIVVPLFFNIYSSRIFEPDKIAILRTLALISLGAWIIHLIEENGLLIGKEKLSLKQFIGLPIIKPVLVFIFVYLIATIFSINPRVSFWGSYQRLQGTYTVLSYITIFFALIFTIDNKSQIDRIVTTIILVSLPISLYGILQRFGLDPIPWGGDVMKRIAANMGNSIFIAAYLIMVFPLTVVKIAKSFRSLLNDDKNQIEHFFLSTIYVFIASLQLIALYFSGSRGPWLGWVVSLVVLWLGLSLIWKTRWLTITGVFLALLFGSFLLTLNIPNGPLENLRNTQSFSRIAHLLDAQSRTGRVRELIWNGTAELVGPHEPLKFPYGDVDKLNGLRFLVGYGPETMYVAFNPFYPPELTQVEKRNASPDRAHNETWDALVITGIFGLMAYLFLFGAVLFYGTKWLGYLNNRREEIVFGFLVVGGGVIASLLLVIWRGIGFFGVALPFGMIMGFLIFWLIMSIVKTDKISLDKRKMNQAYLLVGLLAAIVAHWVEINFGIAIVATRLYFWIFIGMLLVNGFIAPKFLEEWDLSPERNFVENNSNNQSRRKRYKDKRYPKKSLNQAWLRDALLAGTILIIVLMVLGTNFIYNNQGSSSIGVILKNSLLSPGRYGNIFSSGMFIMFFTSIVFIALAFSSEIIININDEYQENDKFLLFKTFFTILGIGVIGGLLFWTIHAGNLAKLATGTASSIDEIIVQVKKAEKLVTNIFIALIFVIFLLAYSLVSHWPKILLRYKYISGIFSVVISIVVLMTINYSNIRVIKADVAFKTAETFAQNSSWPAAIETYREAISLATYEDFYYLFLGRSYIEYAKTLKTQKERNKLFIVAEKDLREAQKLNPLNTDHTANLARLYNLWSSFEKEKDNKKELAQKSSEYYAQAVQMSPNNAKLWDEWAAINVNLLQNYNKAESLLLHSLEIDPYFSWTYGLLGDFYSRKASKSETFIEKKKYYELSVEYYQKAVQLSEGSTDRLSISYLIGLGNGLAQLGRFGDSQNAYISALRLNQNISEQWKIYEMLFKVTLKSGDATKAMEFLDKAIELAPKNEQERLKKLKKDLSE